MIIIILAASAGACLGAAIMAGIKPEADISGAGWRHEQLVEMVGPKRARGLWPQVCAGQLSLLDIKLGVYSATKRGTIQKEYEARHDNA